MPVICDVGDVSAQEGFQEGVGLLFLWNEKGTIRLCSSHRLRRVDDRSKVGNTGKGATTGILEFLIRSRSSRDLVFLSNFSNFRGIFMADRLVLRCGLVFSFVVLGVSTTSSRGQYEPWTSI